jgi:hypothetical protein
MALPFYIKKYLKAKEEELWKLKYFTMQKYNLRKKSLQETKILQATILYNESKHNILAYQPRALLKHKMDTKFQVLSLSFFFWGFFLKTN